MFVIWEVKIIDLITAIGLNIILTRFKSLINFKSFNKFLITVCISAIIL